MSQGRNVFIWTEAFNCVEILPPFLESFIKHHKLEINVVVAESEINLVPRVKGVNAISLKPNLNSNFFRNHEKYVIDGYKQGHLGTARIWSYLIQNRSEDVFVHLDADTVFLAESVSVLIDQIESGYDFVGTRRPYKNRGYRLEGRDAKRLNKHPDALNTDFLAFRSEAIASKHSPLLTRWIRGKRPLRYPVVDFFDPVIFRALSQGRKIKYIDSPDKGSSSLPDYDSEFFKNRISFAAVGSGLNFFKNPTVITSPGYRDYALASYSLYAKYLLDHETGIKPLDNPEILEKLKRLDKSSWTLR